MSRRRRVICLVIGVLMILFSVLMGLASAFLTGRVGPSYSMDTAAGLLEEMQGQGAIFVDEQETAWVLHSAIYDEVQRKGDAEVFGYLITGLNGLILVVFGAWPSRKNKRVPCFDPKGKAGL